MRKRSLAAVAALLFGAATANAQPVTVSYTVGGAAGNWMLNFSITNNLVGAPADMGMYLFGIKTGGPAVSTSPSGWHALGWTMPMSSGTSYETSWISNSMSGPKAGETASGFSVWLNSQSAPTSFKFYAFGFSQSMAEHGADWTEFNPSWEGVAQGNFPQVNIQTLDAPLNQDTPPVSTVPEPSTYALMATGLAVLGFASRRRNALANR